MDRESPQPRRIDVRAFAEQVRLIAGCLFLSTPRLSEPDRQFLKDLRRDEVRYPMKAVERLAAIAQTSTRPEHREAFAELIRKHSTPMGEPMEVRMASDRETEAQGPCDVAVREFEQRPTLANKARAKDAIARHRIHLRELDDAVDATPVYQ